VETPRGERLALDADGRPHAALRHAGVHRMLDHAGGAVGTQVVRIPSDAGRVEAQPEEAVGAWLARTGPWKFVQPGAIASALMRPPAEAGISTPLLMALLGLALLECFLARRFSHAAIERGGAAGGGGILTTLEERAARGRRSSSSESVA